MDNSKQEVCRPILRDQGALAEWIYPVPGISGTETVAPDFSSQTIMMDYLVSRFTNDDRERTRVGYVPTDITTPRISRHQDGFKEVSRLRKTQEWLISPSVALAIGFISLIGFNAIGNRNVIGRDLKVAGQEIVDIFHPDSATLHEITIAKAGTQTVTATAATSDKAGSTYVSPSTIHSFYDSIQYDLKSKPGAQVESVFITGNTSDEWSSLGDASIGQQTVQNTILSEQRANQGLKELEGDGLKISPNKFHLSEVEHVITSEQKQIILGQVKAAGFQDITDAINAVDSGEKLPEPLYSELVKLFTSIQDRGVDFKAILSYPTQIYQTTNKYNKKPTDHNSPSMPRFYGFIPLLPIRKRERYLKSKPNYEWQFKHQVPVNRPVIIKEEQDQVWLRLRPEGMRPDGTLVDDSWAYTRKFEHLMRDGRIHDELMASVVDPNGTEKSLRMFFVDHEADDVTVKEFSDLLTKLVQLKNGRALDKVAAVFVYPTHNAGISHSDPYRIAIGIDKQDVKSVVGQYIYPLKLVEMHMPTRLDPEELEQLFMSFDSPAWTAAHEIGGHSLDTTDDAMVAKPVKIKGIPNAHVMQGEPRAKTFSSLHDLLKPLTFKKEDKKEPIEFDIEFPVLDRNGNIVTVKKRVEDSDKALNHAIKSEIVGHKVTIYGSSSIEEHYAETAASEITGIEVPYDQAHVEVDQLTADDGSVASFATGYRSDKNAQMAFADSVGVKPGPFPVEVSHDSVVTIKKLKPEEDPIYFEHLVRVTNLRSPTAEQLIAILARVAK